MANNLHLAVAGFVFLMVLIGIVLTIVEFRRMPRDGAAPPKRHSPQTRTGEAKKE